MIRSTVIPTFIILVLILISFLPASGQTADKDNSEQWNQISKGRPILIIDVSGILSEGPGHAKRLQSALFPDMEVISVGFRGKLEKIVGRDESYYELLIPTGDGLSDGAKKLWELTSDKSRAIIHFDINKIVPKQLGHPLGNETFIPSRVASYIIRKFKDAHPDGLVILWGHSDGSWVESDIVRYTADYVDMVVAESPRQSVTWWQKLLNACPKLKLLTITADGDFPHQGLVGYARNLGDNYWNININGLGLPITRHTRTVHDYNGVYQISLTHSSEKGNGEDKHLGEVIKQVLDSALKNDKPKNITDWKPVNKKRKNDEEVSLDDDNRRRFPPGPPVAAGEKNNKDDKGDDAPNPPNPPDGKEPLPVPAITPYGRLVLLEEAFIREDWDWITLIATSAKENQKGIFHLLTAFGVLGSGELDLAVLHFAMVDEQTQVVLDDWVDKQPENVAVRILRGTVFGKFKGYNEALKEFQKAVELADDYFLGHYGCALSYASLGDFSDALKEIDKVNELAPDFVSAYVLRAIICLKKNDLDGSREQLAKAKELGNKESAYISNLQGVMHFVEGKVELAQKDFLASLEFCPVFEMAENNLQILRSQNQEQWVREQLAQLQTGDAKMALTTSKFENFMASKGVIINPEKGISSTDWTKVNPSTTYEVAMRFPERASEIYKTVQSQRGALVSQLRGSVYEQQAAIKNMTDFQIGREYMKFLGDTLSLVPTAISLGQSADRIANAGLQASRYGPDKPLQAMGKAGGRLIEQNRVDIALEILDPIRMVNNNVFLPMYDREINKWSQEYKSSNQRALNLMNDIGRTDRLLSDLSYRFPQLGDRKGPIPTYSSYSENLTMASSVASMVDRGVIKMPDYKPTVLIAGSGKLFETAKAQLGGWNIKQMSSYSSEQQLQQHAREIGADRIIKLAPPMPMNLPTPEVKGVWLHFGAGDIQRKQGKASIDSLSDNPEKEILVLTAGFILFGEATFAINQ